jgi:hypothetical protein
MSQIMLSPDRWLLCSADIEASVRGPWRHDSGDGSFLALRLRSAQVELVALQSVPQRARALSEGGCGTIHLVVENLDEDLLALCRTLKQIDAPMQLHAWREDPLNAIGSLVTPEDAVLQTWQRDGSLPRIVPAGTNWPAAYADDYDLALRRWADAVKTEFPEAVEQPNLLVATTLAQVLERLTAAAGTQAAAASDAAFAVGQRLVQMSGLSVRPLAIAAMFKSSSLEFNRRRTWDSDGGVAVSAPVLESDTEGEFEILVSASPQQMALVSHVILKISGAEESLEVRLPEDAAVLKWLDDGRGDSFARAIVRYSPELAAQMKDPAPALQIMFVTDVAPDS